MTTDPYNLLATAELIAPAGPILPAGRWAYRGAAAAAADLPPTARPAAIRAALIRLAADDPTAVSQAMYGLAAMLRAEKNAALKAEKDMAIQAKATMKDR